jgi:hypothetical protein
MPKVNLMPRKKKPAPRPKPDRAIKQTKAEFVLARSPKLSAAEVVGLAKAAGLALTAHRVHNIRWAAKRKGKGKAKRSKVAPRAVRPQARQVRRTAPAARRAIARRTASAPPRASALGVTGIDHVDLAYAVGQLVAQGKTTASEIIGLAAERRARIEVLETELRSLRGGEVPAADVAAPTKAPTPMKPAKPKAPGKKRRARAATKAGAVSTRRDGRTFTMTPKALAARKLQGQYLGHLRQVPAKEKPSFKAIARDQGVAAAVAALKKRLGKKA